MVAVGVALWASSTRWSSGQFQLTLATLGVICSAIRAEMIGRSWLAVILTVLATKVTLVLPIVALLLLRRKWLSVIAIGAIAGTLNLACFAWTGFEASFAGWLLNAKNYVVVNGINYQDVSTLIERTNGNPVRAVAPPGLIMFKGFEYYFYPEGTHWRLTMSALTSNKELAKLGANLLIGASGAVLTWLGWQLRHRADDREAVSRWIIAFTCFDLVVVTHLKYDLLLFVPVCFLAFRLYQEHRLRADLALAALTFAVGFCLFSRIITTWVMKSAELRLFPLVPIYAHFATVAFGLSLYSLWRFAKTGTSHDPALAKAAMGSVPREV
jgi:hypothetical protein